MLIFTTFIELLLLIPYFGWGIYALRRRLRYGDEESIATEVATMIALVLFFMFQISMLRSSMRDSPVLYLFSMLGLFVSAMALYAHTAISLASRLIVDLMKPTNPTDPNAPRLGPALELERQKDYEGALQEYLVMARIYPNQTSIFGRIGEMLVRLDRANDATEWFQRAIDCSGDAEQSLLIVNRLAELYEHTLKQPGEALDVLQTFVEAHPGTTGVKTAEARIARLAEDRPKGRTPQLEAVADVPIMMETAADTKETAAPKPQRKTKKRRVQSTAKTPKKELVALEVKPLDTKVELKRIARPRRTKDMKRDEIIGLERLETSPLVGDEESVASSARSSGDLNKTSTLMSLDDAPLSPSVRKKPVGSSRKSVSRVHGASLESLEESPLG